MRVYHIARLDNFSRVANVIVRGLDETMNPGFCAVTGTRGRGWQENSYGALAVPVAWESNTLGIGEFDELALALDGAMLHGDGAQTR